MLNSPVTRGWAAGEPNVRTQQIGLTTGSRFLALFTARMRGRLRLGALRFSVEGPLNAYLARAASPAHAPLPITGPSL